RSGAEGLAELRRHERPQLGLELVRGLGSRHERAEDPGRLALDLVRDPDRRSLRDHRMSYDGRLELGRPDPLAGDVERVVRAPVGQTGPVPVDRSPAPVAPDTG